MKSVIVTLVNHSWDECVCFGSYWYFNTLKKSCKQLVSCLEIEHTEEQWYKLMELDQEELLFVLNDFMQQNQKHLFFPN